MWATYGHSLITVTWSSLVDVAVTTRDVGLRQQVADEIQASELFEKLSTVFKQSSDPQGP